MCENLLKYKEGDLLCINTTNKDYYEAGEIVEVLELIQCKCDTDEPHYKVKTPYGIRYIVESHVSLYKSINIKSN